MVNGEYSRLNNKSAIMHVTKKIASHSYETST